MSHSNPKLFTNWENIQIPRKFNSSINHLGAIGSNFWETILLKGGNIVYTNNGVNALHNFIEYSIDMIDFFIHGYEDSKPTRLSIPRYNRSFRSLIRKAFPELYEDDEIARLTNDSISARQDFLDEILSEGVLKYKRSNE